MLKTINESLETKKSMENLKSMVKSEVKLSVWVGEAGSRVERVVCGAMEAIEVHCTRLEQQRVMQQKQMDLESRHRKNNRHLWRGRKREREKLGSTVYCQLELTRHRFSLESSKSAAKESILGARRQGQRVAMREDQ